MSRGEEIGATATASPLDPLDEVSRRVGRVHYALAEAGRVDVELQRWCLDQLMDLLAFVERAQGREGEPDTLEPPQGY